MSNQTIPASKSPLPVKITIDLTIKERAFGIDFGTQHFHEDVTDKLASFLPGLPTDGIAAFVEGLIADAVLKGQATKTLLHLDEHGIKIDVTASRA